MALTKKSIEMLIDLLDVRISSFLIQDSDDSKELTRLKKCKKELEKVIQIMIKDRAQ